MSATLAEQLSSLPPMAKPAAPGAWVIPLPTRYETAKAAIAAVPVVFKHPRTLERYRLRVEPFRSARERTTFRRVKAAAPAVLHQDFGSYNAALEFARENAIQCRPIRRDNGASWRVVWPNTKPQSAEWVNVGPWVKPSPFYCDPTSIAETLDALGDFSEG